MFFSDVKYLIFLAVIPCIILLFFYFQHRRNRILKQVFSSTMKEKLAPPFLFYEKLWSVGLKSLILILMILALARPALTGKEIEEESQGLEIIIAVDVSQSMLTQDTLPHRLSLLKVELGRFLAQSRRTDRVGLMAFAGSAFLLAPLTSDLNLIQNYLTSLSVDMMTSQGTNFTSLFEQAQKSFQNGGVGNAMQVLIVASDGENHTTGALKTARQLKQAGVHIFTLGVGTDKGGSIPLDEGYLKDEKGQQVISRFEERTLKEFAKIGEGAFYHIFPRSHFAEKLHNDLNSLEQYTFDKNIRKGQVEIFQYFLWAVLILSLFQWVLENFKTFSSKKTQERSM